MYRNFPHAAIPVYYTNEIRELFEANRNINQQTAPLLNYYFNFYGVFYMSNTLFHLQAYLHPCIKQTIPHLYVQPSS
jgi:hypothetical protein